MIQALLRELFNTAYGYKSERCVRIYHLLVLRARTQTGWVRISAPGFLEFFSER